MPEDEIDELINNFKTRLLDTGLTDTQIVREDLSFGTPYIFKNNERLYFKLKNVIADKFEISHTKVSMVGSSKLGFSIAPSKKWNKIHEDSDIDIVIVSNELFDLYWKDIFKYHLEYAPRFLHPLYVPPGTISEEATYIKFLSYFFQGWLRPDLFPYKYSKKLEWFDFFNSISFKEYDGRKVTAGLYRDENFYESYHIRNINNIRKML